MRELTIGALLGAVLFFVAVVLPRMADAQLEVQAPPTGSVSAPTNVAGTAGIGALTAVPAGSTNGTVLGTKPSGTTGVRLYLPTGSSVTFTIALTAPTSAPSATFTASASSTGPNWDESLSSAANVYVTATTGSPLFRWN